MRTLDDIRAEIERGKSLPTLDVVYDGANLGLEVTKAWGSADILLRALEIAVEWLSEIGYSTDDTDAFAVTVDDFIARAQEVAE